MGLEGEGRGGGKWVGRGREVGNRYPPVHPLSDNYPYCDQNICFYEIDIGL